MGPIIIIYYQARAPHTYKFSQYHWHTQRGRFGGFNPSSHWSLI